MPAPKKQAQYRYAFVDPKTRHFVAANTPGAKRVRVKLPVFVSAKRKPKRLANGRFASATASKRSLAAKKGARTRALKRKGIKKISTWQTPSGSQGFEAYELPSLDIGIVQHIVEQLSKQLKGKRFIYTGGVDFLDANDEQFTNFTHYFADDDKKAPGKLIKQLQQLMIDPSDPKAAGRSSTFDVERTYIVFRFERGVV